MSLNVSVIGGEVAVTPTFLGADPATVRDGMFSGLRVLREEEDLGWALIHSLNEYQRMNAMVANDAAANETIAQFGLGLLDDVPWDTIANNILKVPDQWDAWKTLLKPDGISATDLTDDQCVILQRLVHEIVTVYQPQIANGYLDAIDLDDLSFAWIDSTERGEPHYFRIQGSDFLFEFDNVQSGANHIHQVLCSRSGDFGEALLKRHYEEEH